MADKKKWECTMCGSDTHEDGKVCVVCRKGDTAIRGMVDKEKVEEEKKPCDCD